MTKLIAGPNCGNSPKMEFLKEFNFAFAKGNIEFITEGVTEDIVWNIIGDKTIEGKETLTEELKKMKTQKISELTLISIITHGKEGAVNGIMKMKDGKKYAFADFYEFTGAKGGRIKAMTSYVMGI